MRDQSRDPRRERWPESQPRAEASRPGGLRAVDGGPEASANQDADAYALALEAIERLFLEQRARIAAEMEAARAAAEKSDFKDHESISRAAAGAAQVSWEADEQMSVLKQRLDKLYQERVVEPIWSSGDSRPRWKSAYRTRFRRRIGDRP